MVCAGYVEAMVIPQGARNIRIEEVAEANNFLAVRNDHGKYYLNGGWYIQVRVLDRGWYIHLRLYTPVDSSDSLHVQY